MIGMGIVLQDAGELLQGLVSEDKDLHLVAAGGVMRPRQGCRNRVEVQRSSLPE